ncbi:MAG: MATE family efflux transporter [Bacteroidales bacterium]|nr:MATE family efflux transporter [Bacteroidales bacterium]
MSQIHLSDHFTYGKLIRFTLPSIGMMVFTSLYGVVDGVFVSNFAGKVPFAAVNLIWPIFMILQTLGFMLGTGGNAIISRLLGQKNDKKANEVFSMLLWVTVAAGILIAITGLLLLKPLLVWMGVEGELLSQSMLYGSIMFPVLPIAMLQVEFQTFLVTAERPRMGFHITLAAGIANMVLDALFIGLLRWGVVGAAAATVIGQCIGGIVPLVYFLRDNSSLLRVTPFTHDRKALLHTLANGSSELLSNVSMSLVMTLYNWQLMRYIGEDGVAAYGVLMYVSFVFISCFIGYGIGTAPLFGYHYGACNYTELKNLLRKSAAMVGVFSVIVTILAELFPYPLARVFVGYDQELLDLTAGAFRIYSISFLICGFNIFGSSLFTALGNAPVSAGIAFFRTMVCEVGAVLLLPKVLGIQGIWLAVLVAEAVALLLTGFFIVRFRSKYHYY